MTTERWWQSFNLWADLVVRGYQDRQQWWHKAQDCPVSECWLCKANQLRQDAEKEGTP